MSDLVERLRMINPSVSTLYKTRLEAADEIERLRERCYPDAVVMIDGRGHYVNEIVKAEIEQLRATLEHIRDLRPGYRFPDARDIAREALRDE